MASFIVFCFAFYKHSIACGQVQYFFVLARILFTGGVCMKELHVTQKRYNQISNVGGGLVLVALRLFAGVLMSLINAFLVHSYLDWGFYYPWFFPYVYIGLGTLYIIDAVLLFKKKQAFILLYLVTALVFVTVNAFLSGLGFVFYAGLEILVILYLIRSKRAAVVFETRKIMIIDRDYGTSLKEKSGWLG
jgi:hypothetical protein